jgi:hypothetical protein
MFNNSDFIIKLAQSGHMSEAQRLWYFSARRWQ